MFFSSTSTLKSPVQLCFHNLCRVCPKQYLDYEDEKLFFLYEGYMSIIREAIFYFSNLTVQKIPQMICSL